MLYEFVAGLTRELAHARSLGAQHQRNGALQVHLVERLVGVAPLVPMTQILRS